MNARTHIPLPGAPADAIDLAIELQSEGLKLLLAEMHALAALLPGAATAQHSEAEVEDGFDDMPV